MRKYNLILILTFSAFLNNNLIAQPRAYSDYETRGQFNPATSRESPFEFAERKREEIEAPEVLEGNVGVADALKEFIIPSGYISGETFTENKIFLGGRFFEVDDILQLDIQKNRDKYLYPTMELIIKDIADDYVELSHKDTASIQRIAFNFSPDISSKKSSGATLEGATIQYVGKDALPDSF